MAGPRSTPDLFRAILDIQSSIPLMILVAGFVLAAIVAPVYLARSVFGGWLEFETIVVASTWGAAIALFMRELHFKRLSSIDLLIGCLTVLVLVGVLLNQLGEAGIIPPAAAPQ